MKQWTQLAETLRVHGRAALVTVVAVKGSTPREKGAAMIVTPQGYHGTIGGGTLEWQAIARAQGLLPGPAAQKIITQSLGPDLGQCCGGQVEIATEIFTAGQLAQVEAWAQREEQGRFTLARSIAGRLVELDYGEDPRTVIVFGAGHVGRALVMALAPLPFQVIWVDPRPGAFPAAIPRNAQVLNGKDPLAALVNVPDGTLGFIMSHSHALDLVVTDAALRHPGIAEVGLIGSATKRARFEHRLRAAGVAEGRISSLICPIGVAGIPSKLPAAIAAATAAQILVIDARLRLVMDAAKPQETQASARGAWR